MSSPGEILSAVSVPRVCVHELPALLGAVIAQALEKRSSGYTDLKHVTHTKYRSSRLLGTLWVLWLVCLFPALCWCVPLNAVLGPLWTNLLRSVYWIRENEEAKQLLVEEPCAEVLCARAMIFVGRLGNILAMKIQIVCCCCWHNQFLQICLTFTWVLLKHWMCSIARVACCKTHKWYLYDHPASTAG